jgi:hypothetical protein
MCACDVLETAVLVVCEQRELPGPERQGRAAERAARQKVPQAGGRLRARRPARYVLSRMIHFVRFVLRRMMRDMCWAVWCVMRWVVHFRLVCARRPAWYVLPRMVHFAWYVLRCVARVEDTG